MHISGAFPAKTQPDPEAHPAMIMAMMVVPIPIITSGGDCHRHGALLVHPEKGRLFALAFALCIVPSLGTLVLLYVLAFAEWKVVPAPQAVWQPPPPYPPSRRIRPRPEPRTVTSRRWGALLAS